MCFTRDGDLRLKNINRKGCDSLKTTFYLVRHGDIDLAERIPGRTPGLHLSSNGKKQAQRVAEMLGGIKLDAIYSSPLDRTVETATPLSRVTGLEIIKNDALLEIDFGDWTGRRFEDLESVFGWKQFHFYRNGCIIPGGELMIHVQSRMVSEIMRLRSMYQGRAVAVFSHNDPLKSVLAYFMGVSLDLFLRITVSTGSVSVLDLCEWGGIVRCVNITSDIPSLD